MEKSYRRFTTAVILLVAVFLYGTLGHYVLLYPDMSIDQCAYRTILLLATINEAFTPGELGGHYDESYRVFMVTIVIFGIGVILYALSTITAFFVEGEMREILRLRKMSKEISGYSDHYIICGGGETGHYIATELSASRRPCVIVERDPSRAERLRSEGFACIEGDASDEKVLEKAGIGRARGLAVALPTDKDNLFVTITARQMNPAIYIIAKGIDQNVDKKLRAAGANRVVSPAHIGGMRMASELIRPVAVSFIDRMLHDPEDTTRIEEIEIYPGSELEGQSMAQARFRQKTGLQVVALRGQGEERFTYHPDASQVLKAGTVMVVIGTIEDVEKARKMAAPRTHS